jgi:hypothetical protein
MALTHGIRGQARSYSQYAYNQTHRMRAAEPASARPDTPHLPYVGPALAGKAAAITPQNGGQVTICRSRLAGERVGSGDVNGADTPHSRASALLQSVRIQPDTPQPPYVGPALAGKAAAITPQNGWRVTIRRSRLAGERAGSGDLIGADTPHSRASALLQSARIPPDTPQPPYVGAASAGKASAVCGTGFSREGSSHRTAKWRPGDDL